MAPPANSNPQQKKGPHSLTDRLSGPFLIACHLFEPLGPNLARLFTIPCSCNVLSFNSAKSVSRSGTPYLTRTTANQIPSGTGYLTYRSFNSAKSLDDRVTR